ncbi:MAG: IclR family transcriptional regulator [Actinomycetota bacterium]
MAGVRERDVAKMATERSSASRVASTLRSGLAILEDLAAHPGGAGVTEVARRLGQDKSQVSRLLATLGELGYVDRDPESRRYAAGADLVLLSARLLGRLDVRAQSHAAMRDLAGATGESVHLAVLLADSVVTIDLVETAQPFRVEPGIGTRDPIHCTAIGKAILAFLPVEESARLLANPLLRFTPRTIIDGVVLERDLDAVRRRGFAVDDEEFTSGVRCIAAPVFDSGGYVVASLGISAPAQRLARRMVAAAGRSVREAAATASGRMGWTSGGPRRVASDV